MASGASDGSSNLPEDKLKQPMADIDSVINILSRGGALAAPSGLAYSKDTRERIYRSLYVKISIYPHIEGEDYSSLLYFLLNRSLENKCIFRELSCVARSRNGGHKRPSSQ